MTLLCSRSIQSFDLICKQSFFKIYVGLKKWQKCQFGRIGLIQALGLQAKFGKHAKLSLVYLEKRSPNKIFFYVFDEFYRHTFAHG